MNPAEIAHGPMLIGTVLNILLYGISVTQTYMYYSSGARDKMWIKAFVYILFLADTVQVIFTIVYVYISTIIHFGDFEYLQTGDWIFATDPAITGIIGGCVQAFFAWRVKVLTGSWVLYLIISFCSAASFLMGIATAIAIGIVPEYVEFQKFKVVVIIWLVSAVSADIMITSILVFHLKNHKTGFSNTDNHIDRIIRMTVQTGLLTAVWALVDLLVYLLDNTGTHLIFNFPLSKLYTNSLMSSLNARSGWRYREDEKIHSSHTKSIEHRRADVVNLSSHRPEVYVHVESHAMVDSSAKSGLYPGDSKRWSPEPNTSNDAGLAV